MPEKYLRNVSHISLASFCGTYVNSADLHQTPQNAASDQSLSVANRKAY